MNNTTQNIYLDTNSTTYVDNRVKEKMLPFFNEIFGNPSSSTHHFGWTASKHVEQSREQVANLLGSLSEEVIFTSGATESNNLAIQGMAKSAKKDKNNDRKTILFSEIEHKSVLNQKDELTSLGFNVKLIPVNNQGRIKLDELEELLTQDVLLTSVQLSNGEIGTIQDVKVISKMCHSVGSIYHCDATQGISSTNLDVFDDEIDLLSISAHKIYGPKGIGALFVSSDLELRPSPLMFGGEQEQGIRPGTIPTMLCVGLGMACKILQEERQALIDHNKEYFYKIVNIFKDKYHCTINGDLENRDFKNISIQLKNIDALEFIGKLQPHIAMSTISACTTDKHSKSHVLKAINLNDNEISSTIRIGIDKNINYDSISKMSSFI